MFLFETIEEKKTCIKAKSKSFANFAIKKLYLYLKENNLKKKQKVN